MAIEPSPEETAKHILDILVTELHIRPPNGIPLGALVARAEARGISREDLSKGLDYAGNQKDWIGSGQRPNWVRLNASGFAAAAQPPALSQELTPVSSIVNISSHGQSHAITAHTVNIVGAASAVPPAPTASSQPTKSSWWQSGWAIVSGIVVTLAAVAAILEYFHIEWPQHQEPAAGQSQHPAEAAVPAPIPEVADAQPLLHPTTASPPPPKQIVKPAVGPRAKQAREREPAKSDAPNVVNAVGMVYNNSGIIAPGATATITQQIRGYMPPAPRVMTNNQMAAAVAKLQAAPFGSIIRLNYAASDNNKEVEAFFAQVETVFRRADHWKVSIQRIGKSMGTADGGTLTGEGVGCTVAGAHGSIAVDAMAAAGFPCTRKAADWGVATPPPSDAVISIGSRIVPLE